VCKKLIKTSQPFVKKCQKTAGEGGLTHSVDNKDFNMTAWWLTDPKEASSLILLQVQVVASVVLHHHFTLQLTIVRHWLRAWRPWQLHVSQSQY